MIYYVILVAFFIGWMFLVKKCIRMDDKGLHIDFAPMLAIAKSTLLVSGVASLITWTVIAIVILLSVLG